MNIPLLPDPAANIGLQGEIRPKILIVLHQQNSTPGRLGMMLVERGYQLDIRRPPLGHPLPDTLTDHAGAIIFGGPMSANDKEDYIKREIDWISVPLSENKPFFGICLGAQMMSLHLGGEVKANPAQYAEIGYYPIIPTDEGRAMMNWPAMIYQWHREGFSLPSDATLLVSSDEYPNQAMAYGDNAYGVQFHAELTTWMMNRWTTRGAHRFTLNGAQDREQHFLGRALYDRAVKQWLNDFLDLWIGAPADHFDNDQLIKTL